MISLQSSHLIQSPSGTETCFSVGSFGFFSLRNQAMRLDLAKDVGPQYVDAILELGHVEEAQRCGDRGEKGVAVLRRVAEADHLAWIRHAQRRQRNHGLRKDPAEVAVIAPERK